MRCVRPALLVLCLAAPVVRAAPPDEGTLRFREWYPGFLPGRWERTSVTLTSAADGGVTLEVVTEQPAADQRERFNASGWHVVPGKGLSWSGTVQNRGAAGKTYWFTREHSDRLALVCTPKTLPIHAFGATVQWGGTCTPCYERCSTPAKWTPASVTPRPGVSCWWVDASQVTERGATRGRLEAGNVTLSPAVSSLPNPTFFSAPPGVEHVSGDTDCPPEGLREVAAPEPDWSAFPEGTTALRDVRVVVAKKPGAAKRDQVLLVTRKGTELEVLRDDVRYVRSGLRGSARTADGQHTLALHCWREPRTVHSVDLDFSGTPGKDECTGAEERATSRSAQRRPTLQCRATVDDSIDDEPLVFVPGKILERLDIDADCTKRRALRLIPGLDAPPFVAP